MAQIGHINSRDQVSNLSGNINITAGGAITLTGGNSADLSYAQIGHGGVPAGTVNATSSDHVLIAGTNFIFNQNNALTPATAGNAIVRNEAPDPSGKVTIVSDNLNPTSSGSGHVNLDLTLPNPGEIIGSAIRIYSSARILNNITAGNIDGVVFDPTSALNVDTPNQIWGVTFPAGAFPTVVNKYTVFYKIVGGIIISTATQSGVTSLTANPATFSAAEVIINNGLLQAALATPSDVVIDAATIGNGAALDSSIFVLADVTWAQAQRLTLQGRGGIEIAASLASTSTNAAGPGITLDTQSGAGGNIVIGNGTQTTDAQALVFGGSALAGSPALDVRSGRDLLMLGATNASAEIAGLGPNAGAVRVRTTQDLSQIAGSGTTAASFSRILAGGLGPLEVNIVRGPSHSRRRSFWGRTKIIEQ